LTAIAGLWRLDGRPDAADACERMLQPLAMYGGDGMGAWGGGDVALGRRLRRVLPEDAFDRQPLEGAGGIVLVADARLDNREELGARLGLAGERLRALSDADVMLAAYQRWETDSFDRVAGDYACAVWDGARRRLVLARDPTGRRPLYYHRAGAMVAFASLPKGLHALPEVPYEADEDRIAAWLQGVSASNAPFKGIEAVGAGCWVAATLSGLTVHRHWTPRRDSVRLASANDYAEALRERLDAAVASRLRGATHVGAHLSAGYDSAAVAATAARLLAPTDGKVSAFTAVPREGYAGAPIAHRLIDEGPLAAATAAMHPNIEHVLMRGGGRSPLAELDRNLRLYEQPVLNLCNTIWIDAINDAARDRGLTVMLIGSLGNLGLSYAGMELLPELVRASRWGRWLREARAMTARGLRLRGVLARTFGPWTPEPLWRLASRLNGSPVPSRYAALNRAIARPHGPDPRPWKDGFEMRLSLLNDAGAVTQKGVLAEWGIDVRDPTTDKRLLEFCLGVPTEQFLRDGQPRALARRALADRLPAVVLDSPLTGYQGADWHEGLTADRAGLAAELERLEACEPARRVLDLTRLRRLADNWPVGGWEQSSVREDYRVALLRALSAGHFLRKVSGSNG
jgi:asparagine synthase (glutamine-hydrolysing)